MPKLTKAFIDSLEHPESGQVFYWDDDVRKSRGSHHERHRDTKDINGWFHALSVGGEAQIGAQPIKFIE